MSNFFPHGALPHRSGFPAGLSLNAPGRGESILARPERVCVAEFVTIQNLNSHEFSYKQLASRRTARDREPIRKSASMIGMLAAHLDC